MNSFQTTVMTIAVVILIIIFIGFAVMLSMSDSTVIYPPSSLSCPNYWQQNDTGKCVIPVPVTNTSGTSPPVNMGTWTIQSKLDGKNVMPGLNETTHEIDFNDKKWDSVGKISATCAKRDWARKYGILWDGVSNYNGCE